MGEIFELWENTDFLEDLVQNHESWQQQFFFQEFDL